MQGMRFQSSVDTTYLIYKILEIFIFNLKKY